MLEIDTRQQAILKEIGIRLPWQVPVSAEPSASSSAQTASVQQAQQPSVQTPVLPPQHIKTQLASTPTQENRPVYTESPSQAPKVDTEQLQTRAINITKMAWPELEETARQCEACTLCKSRKQTVFSAGEPTAKWMIVGEAPGEQEDKQGFPFVGPAGQLLDRMLAQLGLSRSPTENQQPVYIANVLKCRPPRNRNPEPAEMAMCEHFLKRQIELVQPKIILVVGRFAVQTLLNTHEAIGRLRGQVHHYKNIPAIVTYHPAYLLRNPVDKRKSWADLCLAAQTFAAQNHSLS